ncbi:hypothetical protein Tco_0233683 [Tanacetum coccineum]
MSTIEVEYVAAAQASKEAVRLKMLLEELGHAQEKITLFCDNQIALYLARNPAFHSKTKHIRVLYHFVHEKVEEGTMDMQKIHTDDNVADNLTKAINCDKFIWCRSSCGLAETPVSLFSTLVTKTTQIIRRKIERRKRVFMMIESKLCYLNHHENTFPFSDHPPNDLCCFSYEPRCDVSCSSHPPPQREFRQRQIEDKLPFFEQPIPAMPVPPAGQVLPPDVLNTHTTWVKASKEIVGLMLMTMDPDIQKNLEHLGAYDMLKELKTLYAQQADQELL